MKKLDKICLKELYEHPDFQSPLVEYIANRFGETQEYTDFVQRVNNEIDAIVLGMESSQDAFTDLPEDTISIYIRDMLIQKSLNADHGNHQSGETDLTVTHGPHTWIGEAKWWRKDEDPLEGMRQLATRYSAGGSNDSGGVLLYNSTGNLAPKVARLRSVYSNLGCEFQGITVSDCCPKEFAFRTEHTHASSGTLYKVRHRTINLHFDPKDKAAKQKAARDKAAKDKSAKTKKS